MWGSWLDYVLTAPPFSHFRPPVKTLSIILPLTVLLLAGCETTSPSTDPVASNLGPAPPSGILLTPGSAAHRSYLGLSKSANTPFALHEIKADVLVVIGFDMYCTVCRREAPQMVEIFHSLKSRPGGDRVRVIGLGIGDTPMEAATFASRGHLPFPVFPDRSNAIAKSIVKPVRVPGVFILKRGPGGFQLVERQPRIPKDVNTFADKVMKSL